MIQKKIQNAQIVQKIGIISLVSKRVYSMYSMQNADADVFKRKCYTPKWEVLGSIIIYNLIHNTHNSNLLYDITNIELYHN